MKTIKKITAAVLGLTIAASFAACGENTAIVANYGSHELAAGVYIINQQNAYFELSDDVIDTETDVWSKTKDGMTAEEYINATAKKESAEHLAIMSKFDELGLEWTEIDEDGVMSLAEYYYGSEAYGALYTENGVSVNSVKEVFEKNQKYDAIFNAYYGDGGLEEVSQKELEKAFEEKYARVYYIPVTLKDGEGNLLKGTDKTDRINMAKDYVAEATKDNIIDLMIEHANFENKLAADAQGKEFTPFEYDPLTEEEEYPFETIVYADMGSSISSTAIEKILAHKDDEKAYLIEEDEVCYVVMNLDISERDDVYEQVENSLLSDMKGEEFDTLVAGWTADAEAQIEWNQEAVDRYKPTNLKV